VPLELRQRIFEPFFTSKPAGQGSGLGLSVVQGIVEQHQGYIAVRDGALGGARFEVHLPVSQQPSDAPSDVLPSVSDLPEAEQTRKSILLVEDETLVRELSKRILVRAGFEVTVAADANEALQRVADGLVFDVLLSDVMLPAMSGPELVARLREQGLTFRVVYMSGYPADFVESRVRLAANERLVHKPFTAGALVKALRHQPE
jgi:two-component system cell cycle sensor histidine kinase/response regulator CckA